MNSYLLDTHPLILEMTGARSKLGRRALRLLDGFREGSVQLHLSAASLVEVWTTERRGKLRLREPLGTLVSRWRSYGLAVVSVEPEDVMEARGLAWDHQDTYDRLIVATALRLRVPIVTGDRVIRAWSGVESVW